MSNCTRCGAVISSYNSNTLGLCDNCMNQAFKIITGVPEPPAAQAEPPEEWVGKRNQWLSERCDKLRTENAQQAERITALEELIEARDADIVSWQKGYEQSEAQNRELREALTMVDMALDNYLSYSPSRRDEKAMGPLGTARKAMRAALAPSVSGAPEKAEDL